MLKTELLHQFGKWDDVWVPVGQEIVKGEVVAMEIDYDWDHDHKGSGAAITIEYIVREANTTPDITYKRKESNLIPRE